MAQINGYKEELQDELQKTDQNSHASRLLAQEIERLEKGEDRKDRVVGMIDVHPQQPQPVALKVRIPVGEFPKFNFVGKLLGPKGNTLKRLQEETGTKMSILGKGSMRDKQKEEELRKEGGAKYSHLNDELHVYVEVFAEMTDAYNRLSHAVSELKKFLIPEGNDDIRQQQLEELMYMNQGQPEPSRGGGRGGFRGGRGGPPASGRGGPPASRGAPRGAPRGSAPPPPRGAPRGGGRGRGGSAPPPPQAPAYDDYSAAPSYDKYSSQRGGYNDGYDNSGYSDQGYGQGDGQYYDYGHNTSSASYDDYSNYADYGDNWGTNGSGSGGGGPVKSARGTPKQRSHPYSGRGGY